MTADGFRPTELNPRMGAGSSQIAYGVADIPIDLLNQAVIAGLDLDFRPADFEALVLETADACRSGGTWKVLPVTVAESPAQPLAWTGDGWRWATDGDAAAARCMAGPSNVAGFVRCTFARGPHAGRARRSATAPSRSTGSAMTSSAPASARSRQPSTSAGSVGLDERALHS